VHSNAVKLVVAALAGVVLLASAPRADAAIVFDGRWSKPGLGNWQTDLNFKPGNANKLDYVRSPRRRRSGYSASLRVGGNAQSERIVFLKEVFKDAEGQDDWWAWSVLIPSDSTIPNMIYLVSLFSGENFPICGFRGPANSLYAANPNPRRPADRWRYILTGGKNTCSVRYTGVRGLPVVKNRWIDFSCHYRWSSSMDPANTGLSQCYYRVAPHRGWTLGFDVTGANLVSGAIYPGALRVHYGLYKGEARPYVHFYLGGLVVATTRAEAEGAAFGADGPAVTASAPAPAPTAGGSPSWRVPLAIAGAAVLLVALLLVRRRARRAGGGPAGRPVGGSG
jgi:hypothetical protein